RPGPDRLGPAGAPRRDDDPGGPLARGRFRGVAGGRAAATADALVPLTPGRRPATLKANPPLPTGRGRSAPEPKPPRSPPAMPPIDAKTLDLLWHDPDAREAALRRVVEERLA